MMACFFMSVLARLSLQENGNSRNRLLVVLVSCLMVLELCLMVLAVKFWAKIQISGLEKQQRTGDTIWRNANINQVCSGCNCGE